MELCPPRRRFSIRRSAHFTRSGNASSTDTEFDWARVQSHLLEAASPIRAVEVNSQSPGTLDYTEIGRTVSMS